MCFIESSGNLKKQNLLTFSFSDVHNINFGFFLPFFFITLFSFSFSFLKSSGNWKWGKTKICLELAFQQGNVPWWDQGLTRVVRGRGTDQSIVEGKDQQGLHSTFTEKHLKYAYLQKIKNLKSNGCVCLRKKNIYNKPWNTNKIHRTLWSHSLLY